MQARHGRMRALATLAVLLLPLAAAAVPPETHAEQRRAFKAAYADVEAGRRLPEGDVLDLLGGYVLYPYLEAAQVRAQLRSPGAGADAAAREFLARHGAEPYARPVRRAFLESLAARQRWAEFLDVYATARSVDQSLRCRAIEARVALGRAEGLVEAITAEWLTGKSAPAACDAGFEWLRARGALTAALVDERARLALAAGELPLARWLARSLPDPARKRIEDWASLAEKPRQGIETAISSPSTSIEPAALLDAWTRFVRSDVQGALDRFEPLVRARGLDAAAASPLARVLAVRLALNRHASSRAMFDRVLPVDYDEQAHEWHARAALWARDWPRVERVIGAMPESLSTQPRWRYFAARAAEARGDTARARQIYTEVLPGANWFAVLASARLGQPFEPRFEPIARTAAQLDALEARPGFARARELHYAEMASLANSEWNDALAALPEAEQPVALGLPGRWGWHFQAISAAAQLRIFHDFELLYPRPFDAEVRTAARISGLSKTLIYAVMRQESLYQPRAISSANARGLMQLLPATAVATARSVGRPRPAPADLLQPAVNVPLGAAYLRQRVDLFDGQVVLALAAYNAGAGAARRWLPDVPLDVDLWVENIPFNETRGYVQRVMWHSVVFQWLESRKPEDASPWLVQVRPREPG
ncbi:MAG: transglycosylase SLT domain-containing protein [Steroidobacteraceae bacterium]|jgi:soluble lytic murein transglycosylase|nr:transglycosylase SLT domain-containing protein [Steroidobacteraceae bacterium]